MLVLILVMALLGVAVGFVLDVACNRVPVIGLRYPVVELVTAVLFVALALRLSGAHLLVALPAYLYFVAVGVALTLIDLGCRRLPNVLVLPSYPIMLALLGGASAWQHDGAALARALIGMGALLALYLVLALIHPAGMGFGDVKLAGVLGAALGYLSYLALVIGAFAGFCLGAVLGLALMLSRRGSRKSAIPFGPFMIAGALLAVFAAEPLGRGYLRLVTIW